MKKFISFALSLIMALGVFTAMPFAKVEASAVEGSDLFTVKTDGMEDNKITYTVYVKSGVKFSGAIIYAKFDPDVLAIDEDKTGPYMVDDGEGDFWSNISGMYEADYMYGFEDRYSIAHAYVGNIDYVIGSSDKAYLEFTFDFVGDGCSIESTVEFYCYEFYSMEMSENNIANGSNVLIESFSDALGHAYGDWVTTAEPTCTQNGEKKKTCSVCEDVLVFSIPANGHDYAPEWSVALQPTCTDTGLEYKKCSACDDVIAQSIPALGHDYDENWTVDLEATCTQEGSKSRHCSVCGDKTDITAIAVVPHNHSTEWIIDVEPTCTENGSKSHHCTVCGDKADVTTILPLGHSYGEWVVDSAPTCTEDGSKFQTCSTCGDVASEVVPATGHTESDWIIDSDSDCTQPGSKHKECVTCGELTKTDTISPKGHSYSTEWTIDIEATCTEDGSKSHHCTACGDKADVTVIQATGHSFGFLNSMESHPHTDTYECSSCGETKTENKTKADCIECNFNFTAIDSNNYKLTSYTGTNTDVVIPATYKNRAVTTIASGCFKGNAIIESVEISNGIMEIGSIAFMNCSALEKIIIPESVTTIGKNAFYGFKGKIYCVANSVAHEYAVANNIEYVLLSIVETPQSQIDYDNFIIRTSVQNCEDITEILEVSETAIAIPVASHMQGGQELYGTGTIITVFAGEEYIGDYTLIVEGDIDGDSVCDAIDAMMAERVSNGHGTLEGAYALAADGNVDGVVDIIDYQSLVNRALA